MSDYPRLIHLARGGDVRAALELGREAVRRGDVSVLGDKSAHEQVMKRIQARADKTLNMMGQTVYVIEADEVERWLSEIARAGGLIRPGAWRLAGMQDAYYASFMKTSQPYPACASIQIGRFKWSPEHDTKTYVTFGMHQACPIKPVREMREEMAAEDTLERLRREAGRNPESALRYYRELKRSGQTVTDPKLIRSVYAALSRLGIGEMPRLEQALYRDAKAAGMSPSWGTLLQLDADKIDDLRTQVPLSSVEKMIIEDLTKLSRRGLLVHVTSYFNELHASMEVNMEFSTPIDQKTATTAWRHLARDIQKLFYDPSKWYSGLLMGTAHFYEVEPNWLGESKLSELQVLEEARGAAESPAELADLRTWRRTDASSGSSGSSGSTETRKASGSGTWSLTTWFNQVSPRRGYLIRVLRRWTEKMPQHIPDDVMRAYRSKARAHVQATGEMPAPIPTVTIPKMVQVRVTLERTPHAERVAQALGSGGRSDTDTLEVQEFVMDGSREHMQTMRRKYEELASKAAALAAHDMVRVQENHLHAHSLEENIGGVTAFHSWVRRRATEIRNWAHGERFEYQLPAGDERTARESIREVEQAVRAARGRMVETPARGQQEAWRILFDDLGHDREASRDHPHITMNLHPPFLPWRPNVSPERQEEGAKWTLTVFFPYAKLTGTGVDTRSIGGALQKFIQNIQSSPMNAGTRARERAARFIARRITQDTRIEVSEPGVDFIWDEWALTGYVKATEFQALARFLTREGFTHVSETSYTGTGADALIRFQASL